MAELTSQDPNPAPPAQWVMLQGSGLADVSSVTWNGEPAELATVDDATIYVWAGQESGEVVVTTGDGDATLWVEVAGEAGESGGGAEGGEPGTEQALLELTQLSTDQASAGNVIEAYGSGLANVTWAEVGGTEVQIENRGDDVVLVYLDNVPAGSHELTVGTDDMSLSNSLPIEIVEAEAEGDTAEA